MLRIEISGVHAPVDDRLKRYIGQKIGRLQRYIPRKVRKSAFAEVKIIESRARDKKQHSCEIILHVPEETITVHETTVNMYAAVDIAEEKLKHSIRKYKELHEPAKLRHRVLRRAKSPELIGSQRPGDTNPVSEE